MTDLTARAAYRRWPVYNKALRDVVERLTDDQLATRPTPERWPIWATIGHVCCQRVSGLCGVAGVPGAESTPFPDALYRCPGDEYLEPAMNAAGLTHAIDSTFRIVESVLDAWSVADLDVRIETEPADGRDATRGLVLAGSFAHDVYHVAELNESLSQMGLPLIDIWS
jgi:hypothetical protein